MAAATIVNGIITLKEYLLHSKNILPSLIVNNNNNTKFDIVIGNESGDCDSIVSSILHAYFLFSTKKTANVVLPILSMPMEDLKLRGAESFLLKNCGIDSSNLIFTDQIPWQDVSLNIDKVTLVDHNVLSHSMVFLNPKVYEIIDHHKDESQYSEIVDPTRRNIEKVGSCSTLIAENFLRETNLFVNNVDLQHNNNNTALDSDNSKNIASLLLSTILLDTMNLSPEAKKATQKDINIINKFQLLFKQWDNDACKKWFENLHSVKFNPEFWLSLSTVDKLRLDYKQYVSLETKNTLGISAVLIPLGTFINDDKFIYDCFEYISTKKLNVLVIMTMTLLNGVPSRELLIISKCKDDGVFNKVIKCIEESTLNVDIQLEDEAKACVNNYGGTNGVLLRCYKQHLVTGSRKIVAPLLKHIL
jgi:exopolyphosphatase